MSQGEDLLAWQLTQAGIDFAREFRFTADRQWRFDFALQTTILGKDHFVAPGKVAVEVEGGVWARGRHTRGAGFEADAEKYNEAALLGWRVLRFTTAMVEDGRALAIIERALGR